VKQTDPGSARTTALRRRRRQCDINPTPRAVRSSLAT
jgi:hypothetical protein